MDTPRFLPGSSPMVEFKDKSLAVVSKTTAKTVSSNEIAETDQDCVVDRPSHGCRKNITKHAARVVNPLFSTD